jgi:hypothetical protein
MRVKTKAVNYKPNYNFDGAFAAKVFAVLRQANATTKEMHLQQKCLRFCDILVTRRLGQMRPLRKLFD